MTIPIHIDSLSSFIGAIISGSFAIYYLTYYLTVRRDHHLSIQSFSLVTFCIYLFGYSMYATCTDVGAVLFWTRVCYTGGAMIIYSSYLLYSEVTGIRNRLYNKLFLFLTIFLVFLVFAPGEMLFVPRLNPIKYHSSVIKGPLFIPFLAGIYAASIYVLSLFIIAIIRHREIRRLISPLVFGLIYWFLEALFDGVFAAIFSMVHMKLSLGPIVMTFSLAIYRGKFRDLQHQELVRIKEENEKIYKNLIYDSLSGLFTREYFFESLAQRIASIQREPATDTVVFIDVDNFKSVNDKLGHSLGDAIIQVMGRVLKNHSRKSDICARFGGDEFLVLLENCGEENARKIAVSIQEEFVKTLPDSIRSWDKDKTITLSIGLVPSPEWGGDPQDVVQKADLAMYEAKRLGRNRICAYSPSFEEHMPSR